MTSVYAQAALANLHLRAGRLGQAVWMLTPLAVEGSGMSKTRRGSIEHGLAYAFALGGALDTAERHLSVTARLRDPLSPLGCLLLCKRREFGTLVELSTRQPLAPRATRSIDSAFEWHRERVVALLSAFAHAAEPGLVADSQERIEEFLDAARPTYAGEFDYLLAGWTELQSFVEAHAARLRVRSSGNVNSSPPRASVVRAGTASW